MDQRVRVTVTPHEISVRIQDVPHLILRRSDVVGVQGYIKNVGPVTPIYFIEVATRAGEIVCDYEERALWEEILKGFGGARLYDERLGE